MSQTNTCNLRPLKLEDFADDTIEVSSTNTVNTNKKTSKHSYKDVLKQNQKEYSHTQKIKP